MDGYNFFDYVPTSYNEEGKNDVVQNFFHNVVENIQNFDNEEGENDVVQSFFHNVVENIQNFDNQWDEREENAEYTVMEVIPHRFTGKVSFFMCVFVIFKIHSDFK